LPGRIHRVDQEQSPHNSRRGTSSYDIPIADLVSLMNLQNRLVRNAKLTSGSLDPRLRRANILKPQNTFERKTDNFDDGPWKPLLTTKPHARVPLEESLSKLTEDEDGNPQYDYSISLPLALNKWPSMMEEVSDLDMKKETKRQNQRRRSLRRLGSRLGANGKPRHSHPYETEIIETKYPDDVYENREPIKYSPVEETSAIWVDTFEGVLEMLEDLKKAKEIAVDLEHHDYRTYTGLLSLMQISTREKDWIIDTLQPWRHKLEILNEVFTDPSILKASPRRGTNSSTLEWH
jgi:exosome complex exonuclease RRP6